MYYAIYRHEYIWRRDKKQRDDSTISKRSGERGEEVLESAGADNGHVRHGTDVLKVSFCGVSTGVKNNNFGFFGRCCIQSYCLGKLI